MNDLKSVLKKLGVYLCLFVVIAAILQAISYYLLVKYALRMPKEKHILIVGDSNAATSLDDHILSKCYNMAQPATSYFYTYLKLKAMLDKNLLVDTVILSFAPQNLYKKAEEQWLFERGNMQANLSYYYPYLDQPALDMFYQRNRSAFIGCVPTIFRDGALIIIKVMIGRELNFNYGRFDPKATRSLFNYELAKVEAEKNMPSAFHVSNIEHEYLQKIVSECISRNVTLILINTPKRKELIASQHYGMKEFYTYYKTYLSQTPFLDFAHFDMADECYGDHMHLSTKGATSFSQFIQERGFPKLLREYQYH